MNTIPTFIKLSSTRSTNTYLAEIASDSEHGTVVSTIEQTAGRGQRGNSWEAEPGKNLTFSILLRPKIIDARHQFAISEIVSIAITSTLQKLINGKRVAIKWPNDIYVDDMKICGILIENSLMGYSINYSIAGIGINVNQQKFLSDAPNPISLYNLIGKETELDSLLDDICSEILRLMEKYNNADLLPELHDSYIKLLWRNEGYHPYQDTSTLETFNARIIDVAPTGLLSLQDDQNATRIYAFKEVSAIL